MARSHFASILIVLVGIFSLLKPSYSYGSAGIQVADYPTLVTSGGLPPGYYRLIPGDLVQIQSSNYGLSTYASSDTSTWRFSSDGCGINVRCPCFKVPASFQCFGDYLRFIDTIFYTQRFCGSVAPQEDYRSVSGTFKITFRSDATRSTGQGYLCYVGCTAPGQPDKMGPVPMQIPCFMPTTLPPPGATTPTMPGGTQSTTTVPSGSPSPTTTLPPTTTTDGGSGMVTNLFPASTGSSFLRFPAECQDYWRQIPVGETIRENKPSHAVKPRPPHIPPWCWI